MQEMNDEELESVEGGSLGNLKLKSDLSKYFFYPEKSVKKNGTKLEVTENTKKLREHLATAVNGGKVVALSDTPYSFTQSGKVHTMYYVKLSFSGKRGYINKNAIGGNSILTWNKVN